MISATKVTVDFGNGKTKEYEVMAIGDIAYALSPQFSNMLDIYFTMYSDEFIAQTGETNALNIAFNAKDGEYAALENQVKNYCENIDSDLDFKIAFNLRGQLSQRTKICS